MPETTVSAKDKNGNEGWSCRPLVPDPIYSLNLTYDECINERYVSPTVDNLLRYGLFGSLVYASHDGFQPANSYDGPWNFTTGLRWSINTMTMYHKPFPSLSDVVYTYPSNCVVPFYAGYEKHEKFNPEDGYTSPLEMPFSEALKRGYDWFNGYGFIGLGNKQPEFDDTCNVEQPWNCGKYVTFHPSNETDYVKQCNGTISEEEQADLFANGTYAYPHIFAQELKWSAPACAQPYVEEGKGDYFVVYKKKKRWASRRFIRRQLRLNWSRTHQVRGRTQRFLVKSGAIFTKNKSPWKRSNTFFRIQTVIRATSSPKIRPSSATAPLGKRG